MRIKKGPIFRTSLFFLFIMIWPLFGGLIFGGLIPSGTSYPIRLIISHIIIFILPAVGYILITKQNFKKVLRLNKIGIKDILIAILIGIIAQPVMSFFAYISSFFFTNDVAGMITELNSTPLWLMILMIGVTPSISEEITMRGIILSGYNFKNKHVAAIMSGLVFGIIHMNPHQFLYAFVMGIIFGYMVRAANSLYVAMIAHFVINTSQLLLQRVLTSISKLMGQSTELDPSVAMEQLNAMPLSIKISQGIFYGIIAIIGFFIIKNLILALENSKLKRNRVVLDTTAIGGYTNINEIKSSLDITRDIDTNQIFNMSREEVIREKILNIPFVIAMLIFIYQMTKFIMLQK